MRKKVLFVIVILFLVFFGGVVIKLLELSPFFFQLFFNRNIELKTTDEHTNILLLGTGGGTHEGPDLTDTIIFASINEKKNKVVLVSIPRDLWIVDLDKKINSAYAIGNSKQKGGGIVLTKAVVSKIIKQPIDYVVRIDFDGFVKAIDLIGGLDITVDNALDDKNYPIEGKDQDPCDHTHYEIKEFTATASGETELWDFFSCRYETLHFDAGPQEMDGKKALQFVRSRHAHGQEGTDFARSKRQEKVIAAFKDKVFTLGTLLNPIKVIGLYSTFKDSIDTNIEQGEVDDFVKLAEKLRDGKIESAVIDYGDPKTDSSGLLIHPDISSVYNNEWVLIPRTGNNNFEEIQKYIDCEIKIGNCPITKFPTVK